MTTIATSVSSAPADGETQITSIDVPVPAGAQSGDVVYMAIETWDSASPTFGFPSGFTQIGTTLVSGDGNQRLTVAYKVLSGADSGNYTTSISPLHFAQGSAVLCAGIDNANPVHGTPQTFNTGPSTTAYPTLNQTTSVTCDLIFFACCDQVNVGTHTPPTSFTEDRDDRYIHTCHRDAVAAGSVSASGGGVTTGSQLQAFMIAAPNTGGGGAAAVDGWTLLRTGFMVSQAFPAFMRAFAAPFSTDSALGTDWTVAQTDGAGLTDSVLIDQLKVVIDAANPTDSTVTVQAKVATDDAGITDTTAISQSPVASDAESLTDSTTVSVGRGVSQTDTEGLTDTQAVDQGKAFAESEGLTDTQSVDQAKVASDLLGLTDSSLVENGKLVSQTDLENLTDTTAFAVSEVKSDDTGLTDSLSLSQAKVSADSEGLTDSVTVESGRSVAQTDAAGMTDSVAIILGAVKVDTATLTDSVTVTFTRILTDLVGLTDAAVVTLTAPVTDDPNPVTVTYRDTGHTATVRAERTRQTVGSQAATTVREPSTRLTQRPSTHTTAKEQS